METTVAKVNAALKAAGHQERLRRGKDYYYFAGGNAVDWRETAVYVNRVDAFTVDGWVRLRDDLAKDEA